MDGNPYAAKARHQLDMELNAAGALAEAQLAVAFELRTLTLAITQNTPDWLDAVRSRLGHPTESTLIRDEPWQSTKPFTAATPPTPEERDQRCNKPLMDGRNEIRCWGPKDHEGDCT